jgi:hypothetical protein
MSRPFALVIIAATLGLTATPAYPCLNGTIYEGDEAVKAIVQIEAYLEAGNYGAARGMLTDVHWFNAAAEARAADAEMVVALRTAPRRVARNAIDYFAKRSKQNPKNLRYRAWLAESYAAVNKREEALAILTDLHQRDVMPDGFAYVTLAKLSNGPDVDAWLDTCRKRAKIKSICAIPTAARKPAKTRRTFQMKLPG